MRKGVCSPTSTGEVLLCRVTGEDLMTAGVHGRALMADVRLLLTTD